jgi:hypothetical protein
MSGDSLTTARLLLRRWRGSDRAPFAALNAGPRLMQRLGMTRDPRDDFDHPALAPGDPLRAHVLHRLSAEAWRGARTH